jgi:hypothetical protein
MLNLFDLPTDIFQLFIEFLEMNDFCFFETSICNKKLRKILLNMIKSDTFILRGWNYNNINNILQTTQKNYFLWLNIRSISIQKFYIRYSTHYSIDISENIIKNSPYLKILDVSCCSKINNNFINKISQYSKNLLELNLSGCSQITNISIIAIADNLTKLKKLKLIMNLRYYDNIDDLSITYLTRNCIQIEELYLRGFNRITNKSVHNISENLLQLQKLDICYCICIDHLYLLKIFENCNILECFYFGPFQTEYSINIATNLIEKMIREKPNMTIKYGKSL